jgi:AraC-like DNA-binding protein/mannose-6-phosphate isomerase-like protein (cupin superfamily)
MDAINNRESLREERIHGTVSYPLAVYDNYNRYPHFSNQILDIHWHDETELLYVERGPMLFRLNETLHTVNTGQGIVIPSGIIHAAESINGKPFLFKAIVFNLSLIDNDPTDECHQKFFKHIRDKRYHLHTVINSNEEWGWHIIEKMKMICQLYYSRPSGFEMGIKSALYDIFFHFFIAGKVAKGDVSGSQREIERFKKVFEYIKQSYALKVSIEELAEKSCMSKYHFIRIFKRMTGRTPLDYLNHYRIQQAAKMLEADKLKIIDIAYEVGINDCSYFTKLFHKYLGVNPSEYRSH